MTDQTDLNEVEIDEDQQETQQEEQTVDIDLDTELLEIEEPELAEDEEEPEEDEDLLTSNPVRQLRTVNRDLAKKLKLEQQEKLRLQKQLESTAAPVIEELPPEPDLSDEGIDYDPAIFKQRWAEWNVKKQAIEKKKEEAETKAKTQQEKFNQKLASYEQGKANYKGITEAEKTVTSVLSVNQQGIVVSYADDPAFVVYALGKNPIALNQLAAIDDPIEYAIKVREIERKAKEKMTTSSKAPPPEKVVTGKTAIPSNHQKRLDQLRESGNITESLRLKKQLRAKGIDVR